MKAVAILMLLTIAAVTHGAPQYSYQYATANPYAYLQQNYQNPYAYTTPYPAYGQNSMRIWPYVTGQYGYPTYSYNGYDANSWYNWYNNILYRPQYYKKK